MNTLTTELIAMTNVPYDGFNAILPLIKQKLGNRSHTFEAVLVEELPLTTARRAYRTAIMVACGEDKVYREVEHQKPEFKKKPKARVTTTLHSDA
jgi:hypothetical protein